MKSDKKANVILSAARNRHNQENKKLRMSFLSFLVSANFTITYNYARNCIFDDSIDAILSLHPVALLTNSCRSCGAFSFAS